MSQNGNWYSFKVACTPVFSRSTNLQSKLIEFFVFVNFELVSTYYEESVITIHCPPHNSIKLY